MFTHAEESEDAVKRYRRIKFEQAKTIAENTQLDPEERFRRLEAAKGGTWYDGWRPYCITYDAHGNYMKCSSPRMIPQEYGFRCPDCGNMLGWDLERLKESPLNKEFSE